MCFQRGKSKLLLQKKVDCLQNVQKKNDVLGLNARISPHRRPNRADGGKGGNGMGEGERGGMGAVQGAGEKS